MNHRETDHYPETSLQEQECAKWLQQNVLHDTQAYDLIYNRYLSDIYIAQNVSHIESWKTLEAWDIIVIEYIKDYTQKDKKTQLKILVSNKYRNKILCLIEIEDESWRKSAISKEVVNLPIIKWGHRKISLDKWGLFTLQNSEYFVEKRIDRITHYIPTKRAKSIEHVVKKFTQSMSRIFQFD